jgi:thymidylate synthase (FAD)
MSNDKLYPLQDEIGAVELLEVFGSDLTVVNAARVSFAKEVHEMSPADERLVAYLAKHDHVSPFFHPQARFRIKMPIFVAREWYRHTIGLARNEVSRRYVDTPPELWFPSAEGLRARDPKLKQGSKEEAIGDAAAQAAAIEKHGRETVEFYHGLLAAGVAPEIARGVLPQSMYTEFIETGSLAAYARIWALRTDPTAQREIQAYARAVGAALEKAFPVSWKALTTPKV